MPLKVLIVGAGICGPAMALMLRRSDPENSVTIVERYPGIRHNGLQIDLRAWGVPIMKRLGLMDVVREKVVHEAGFTFVDAKGGRHGVFGTSGTNTGAQSFTSEFEIMRGDLAQLLYEASLKDPKTGIPDAQPTAEQIDAAAEDKPGVRYRFGITPKTLAQDDDGVDVTFSDGTERRYDLVIGADGQWSRTRRMLFGEEAGLAMLKPLNLYIAYYTIPTIPSDGQYAQFYMPGGGRGIAIRAADRPETQVYLMVRTDSEEVRRGIERQSVETQIDTFAKIFQGVEWQGERFIEGMRKATDFYADAIGQVKAPHVAKGRVALLGDAAYCAAPITGMGTTVSLLGAWTLAGELARHKGDVKIALEAYDVNVRPYIDEAQKLAPGVPWLMTLDTQWGVKVLHFVMSMIAFFKIDKLIFALMPEDKAGMAMPEYPELKIDGTS
ncbi:FAD/NAD(P)-binding domain-containing protein [Annulohypoxylon maeteangense]|uniref:FAD/NAD(P)-binding domain-containing protein n=1 Tax=Annulohypoxylon maeteangense TaxID=1927788 RepID=UPI0020086AB1|nr:FAD/NAD(P)-binding domain-containing protein [Annulohypoxylon maeteangense]KAI0888381.1 FAD/NAD(P)-binding domain-containing protein [Annulohypoxylon maeteangense]